MNKALITFYKDTNTREAVFEYFIGALQKMAIEDAFSGNDTKGYDKAKLALEKAHKDLEHFLKPEKEKEGYSPR